MALADTSEVDAAVLAVLNGDAALRALVPGGVWFDLAAGENLTRYVLVTQEFHEDTAAQSGTAFERVLYAIKCVMLNTSGGDAKAAAARIHDLLEDARFSVTGYKLMLSQRTERIRYTERDEVTGASWHHRGGQYEVFVSPGVLAAERGVEFGLEITEAPE